MLSFDCLYSAPLCVSWESEHVRWHFTDWDALSSDESWESGGAVGIISCLISGKVRSGKTVRRCSSNSSLSLLPAMETSVSACSASGSKDEVITVNKN